MKVSYFINYHNDLAVCRRHSRLSPLNSEPIHPDQLPQVKYERQLQLIQTEEKVASHSLRQHQLKTHQTQMNSMRPVLIGAARFNRS
jgi:hypothetical protein